MTVEAIPIPANGKIDPEVYTHPVGEFRVLRLTPQDPFTRQLFPKYVQRCLEFIEVTSSDTDPVWLGSLLYGNFYNQTNYIHCLVGIDEKDNIIGHAFTYMETTPRLGIHGHILQIWKDKGSSDLLEIGLSLIEEWAREAKLKVLVYSADSLAKMRLYNSSYGFKLHRVLGIKHLEGGE